MSPRKSQTSTAPAALIRNEPAPAPLSSDVTQGQSPAPTPAATPDPEKGSGDSVPVVKRIAKHELLGQDGALLADDVGEESAHGMRYTLLANNQSFEYKYGVHPDADRMLAVFGAKTLATNETSQARNNLKGGAGPDEQIDAVRERFGILANGQWVDRTRDGVGTKIDLDALTEATIQVQIAEGAKRKDGTPITAELAASGYKAELRQKFDDDKNFVKSARGVAAIASAYAAIVGRSVKTLDDIAF